MRRGWFSAFAATAVAILIGAACTQGDERPCYTGPAGTEGVGVCRSGGERCQGATCKDCHGEVTPHDEVCNGLDDNCNGVVDEGVANACGGCTTLQGKPGDDCGTCGSLFCSTPDKLDCGPPGHKPGTPCVSDQGCSGTYTCGADGKVTCTAPAPNACGLCGGPGIDSAKLGTTCTDDGFCTGHLRCSTDGSQAVCVGGKRNECGVCAPSVPNLGASCLAPNGCTGTRVCNQNGDGADCTTNVIANECRVCGGAPVPGVGQPCTAVNGKTGVQVCNDTGDGTVCAATVVTLSFDDTFSDSYQAGAMLEQRAMRGVFYVNAPRFTRGQRFMTLQQVLDLQTRGHEIGGHTLDHAHLPALTVDNQHVEICNDRFALLGDGLMIRDFAYPFGEATADTEQAVQDCGYNSARGVGDLLWGTYDDTFVPQDVWRIRAPTSIRDFNVAADMEADVANAEQIGGWVIVNNHHVCDDCGDNQTHPAVLSAFLDWLQPRTAQGTYVRTPQQMIAGDAKPPVKWGNPLVAGNLLQNPSLELDSAQNGIPDCWKHGGAGLSDYTWVYGPPHSGQVGVTVTINNVQTGGRGLESVHDAGVCAPAAVPGHRYTMSAWYVSPNAAPFFVTYYRDTNGNWQNWQVSPQFPPSTTYVQATWSSDELPMNAAAIGIELQINAVGSLTMDDFSLVDETEPMGDE